jgi:TDG/mug DNA glycosylase family protein
MKSVSSFEPVSHRSARVLVLGSMPGEASLRAGEYYAHPRNAFWKIMEGITGVPRDAPYPERTGGVIACGIALWDVLKSCIRPGSLDSKIVRASALPNDFQMFFSRHKGIQVVCFNGAAAEREYRRQVMPIVAVPNVQFVRLPSSSSALAAMSLTQKAEAWRAAVCVAQAGRRDGPASGEFTR